MGGLPTASPSHAARRKPRAASLTTCSLIVCAAMHVLAASAAASNARLHPAETEEARLATHEDFFEEMGIATTPNVAKMNISQEEYIEKMSLYLSMLNSSSSASLSSPMASHHPQEIPQLHTYNSENKSWRRRRDESVRLHFRIQPVPVGDVQSAEVRLLFPPQHSQHRNTTHFRLYQLLSPRRRRLLAKKTVHLSHTQTKWADFDATKAMADWMSTGRNLGLLLECDDCRIENLRPIRSALNALIKHGGRTKRSYFDTGRSTDCSNINALHGDKKPKCCRHEMQVSFEKLAMDQIIQPKAYEAGFCRGRCPLNFNHATNHSRIQNLVHKLDKRSTPRACCAPSKLEPLEILMVDPNDPSKLTVERWDNMIVLECACS